MNALQSIGAGRITTPQRPATVASLLNTKAPLDLVSLGASPDPEPTQPNEPRKTVGQALLSAAKWGAVGGVLSAVPGLGYLVSAVGGAIAADVLCGKSEHTATPMLMGATAGIATHVIPMSGYVVHAFGFYQAFLPATVIFGAASWGLVAYQHARGSG